MTGPQRPAVDLDALRALVSPAVWARGQDYAERGVVSLVSVAAGRVVARVEGNETYRCTLAGDGLLDMACTCPAFQDHAGPCKHLVATALTLARRPGHGPPPPAERLRRFLGGLPPGQLVELLVGLAEADPELEAKLLLQADAAAASPEDLGAVLTRATAAALRTGEFVDYRGMAAWSRRVDDLIDQLAEMARAGRPQAAAVLERVPELIAGLERAVEHTDDDGHIGMLLHRAAELLATAALQAKPEPRAFGRLIARLDLGSRYAEIGPPAGPLAEALGDEGLAAYWSVLEAEWAKLATLRPAERNTGRRRIDAADVRRWQLRERLVARARERGDADAEIAVLSKTLADPHDYLQVAKVCRDHGRVAEAAARIDEALRFFAAPDHPQLARDGAAILAAAGQTDRALGLLWEQFTRRPSLEDYRDLERLAGPVGEAAAWRERAVGWLDRLRRGELPEAERPVLYGQTASGRAADVLVELSLAANDLERAWAVAGASRLSQGVWRRLAEASETARPAESLRIYQRIAEEAVASGHKQGYREAVDLVRAIKRLGAAAGVGPAVEAWLAGLRTRHKAKRSFIALLDAAQP